MELFFSYITLLGSIWVIAPVFFLIAFFLWRKDGWLLKPFVVVFLTNETLVYLIKKVVGRLRPLGALKYGEFDGSFPSGHAAASIFIFGYACYLLKKFYPKSVKRDLLICSLVLLIVLIGVSRVYLNIHYPSDVAGGYLLGGALLLYLIKFYRL